MTLRSFTQKNHSDEPKDELIVLQGDDHLESGHFRYYLKDSEGEGKFRKEEGEHFTFVKSLPPLTDNRVYNKYLAKNS